MTRRFRSVLATLASPVASQLARPHGPGAAVVGRLLNVVNRSINRAAVEALAIQAGERILDVGFGGGVGMRLALQRVGDGCVTGVDLSPEVVASARRQFHSEIGRSRLKVMEGRVERLPVADASFDGAYTVNTVYFWPDVSAALVELRRVLGSGGRLVVAMETGARREHGLFSAGAAPAPEALVEFLAHAGFNEIRARRQRGGIELVLAHKS